jgi:LacI family transcriptional regulator
MQEPNSPTPRPRRATIADVAALAGVDRAIVSRVSNNDPRLAIRDSTRQRVLKAIEDLGYRPNVAARSLRTARAGTVGMLIPDFANPAYTAIVKGAEIAAAEVGSMLLTGSIEGAGKSADNYLQLLGNGRVDGLLLAIGGHSASDEESLARLGFPWLFVNRTGTGRRRYVIQNDANAVALAVQHLVELGHTRLAYISGPHDNDSAQRRRRGYLKAVEAADLADESGTIIPGRYTLDGGAAAMERALLMPKPPTAVVAGNTASAIGALQAAHRLGAHIPGDVSVVGIHDVPMAAHLVPPLTTVMMPLERLGARAIELLLERPVDEDIREVTHESARLIVRASTAPPGNWEERRR